VFCGFVDRMPEEGLRGPGFFWAHAGREEAFLVTCAGGAKVISANRLRPKGMDIVSPIATDHYRLPVLSSGTAGDALRAALSL